MFNGCSFSETNGNKGLGSKLVISCNSGGLLIASAVGGAIDVGSNDVGAAILGDDVADVGGKVVSTVGVVFQAGTISNIPSSLSNTKDPSLGLM